MQSEFCYIQVALPIGLNELFTYKLLHPFNENYIGRRVLVPFKNKKVTGIITKVSNNVDHSKFEIKLAYELLDEFPIISNNLLKLAEWISKYYFSPIGETLKAMVPLSLKIKSENYICIKKYLNEIEFEKYFKNSVNQRKIYEFLIKRSKNKPISQSFLKKKFKLQNIATITNSLAKKGLIEIKDELPKVTKQKTEKYLILHESFFKNEQKLTDIFNKLEKKSPKKFQLLLSLYEQFNQNQNIICYSTLLKEYSRNIIDFFVKNEIISIIQKQVDKNDRENNGFNLANKNELELALTDEQNNALSEIKKSLDLGVFQTFLLFGITGSGKTLIYLHSIKKALELGKTVLVLVPEISLTPQLIDRFSKSFPGEIAVFHSKMSESERYDAFIKTLKGEYKIAIGARSAVFAPLNNIGLIIIDEEHENSYKQDSPNPRYNGRDTAIMRGKIENATVVLGSATPSLESFYNTETGKYKLLKITTRADGAKLPIIRAIDTISSRKKGKMLGEFTNELLDAIKDRIAKKEGVILFQNRRGFATYLQCPDCGDIPMCSQCSVSLVYHKTTHELRCHYCGYTEKSEKTCKNCGYPDMREIGAGTQRIEDELNDALEMEQISYTIERVDLDTTKLKGSHRAILERFAKGETDILVGTQMVAKGLDFERLTLVGVINADLLLCIPNFRAYERAFQLLAQVAGRAGRHSTKPGEVIIQTSQPDTFIIKNVVNNDYLNFYSNEILIRKNAQYPPFYRFCVIEFKNENVDLVEEASHYFRKFLKNTDENLILGPVVPVINKIKNQYRRVIVIKNDKAKDSDGSKLRKMLNFAQKNYNSSKFKGVKHIIDIDSFMSM